MRNMCSGIGGAAAVDENVVSMADPNFPLLSYVLVLFNLSPHREERGVPGPGRHTGGAHPRASRGVGRVSVQGMILW